MSRHDQAPKTLDFLCPECRAAFEAVLRGLDREGIRYRINPQLVRGLDYYTRTAFEYWHESLSGAQNALGGGGRYDGLAEDLGYRRTPGVGFALGLERTATILKNQAAAPAVYAIAVQGSALGEMQQMAKQLRERGLAVIVDVTDARLDAKLKRADRLRAALALLVGLEEDGPEKVSIKDLRHGNQTQVDRLNVLATVLHMLVRPAQESA